MINNLMKIMFLSVVGILAVGCTKTQITKAFEMPKITSQQAICVKLKREMLYHAGNRNTEAAWATREQRAHYAQRLKDNKCQ